MSNHTPGPWHVFKVSDYWIIGEIPPAPGRHIARASSMLGDETVANARLMAEAPELYELARIVQKCDEFSPDPHVQDAIEKARAILVRLNRSTPEGDSQ